MPGGMGENIERGGNDIGEGFWIGWISVLQLVQCAEQGASHAAGSMRPDRIGRDSFQSFSEYPNQLQVSLWVCHTERPRRGSNAQPPDSKSVTLSIELRGQYKF